MVCTLRSATMRSVSGGTRVSRPVSTASSCRSACSRSPTDSASWRGRNFPPPTWSAQSAANATANPPSRRVSRRARVVLPAQHGPSRAATSQDTGHPAGQWPQRAKRDLGENDLRCAYRGEGGGGCHQRAVAGKEQGKDHRRDESTAQPFRSGPQRARREHPGSIAPACARVFQVAGNPGRAEEPAGRLPELRSDRARHLGAVQAGDGNHGQATRSEDEAVVHVLQRRAGRER